MTSGANLAAAETSPRAERTSDALIQAGKILEYARSQGAKNASFPLPEVDGVKYKIHIVAKGEGDAPALYLALSKPTDGDPKKPSEVWQARLLNNGTPYETLRGTLPEGIDPIAQLESAFARVQKAQEPKPPPPPAKVANKVKQAADAEPFADLKVPDKGASKNCAKIAVPEAAEVDAPEAKSTAPSLTASQNRSNKLFGWLLGRYEVPPTIDELPDFISNLNTKKGWNELLGIAKWMAAQKKGNFSYSGDTEYSIQFNLVPPKSTKVVAFSIRCIDTEHPEKKMELSFAKIKPTKEKAAKPADGKKAAAGKDKEKEKPAAEKKDTKGGLQILSVAEKTTEIDITLAARTVGFWIQKVQGKK